jgi:hypothetical protein
MRVRKGVVVVLGRAWKGKELQEVWKGDENKKEMARMRPAGQGKTAAKRFDSQAGG